mmetsp:Transcript_451/g.700  ORF Transcript_451/g.700 Transcript_451/m.700 type:complete len:203 (-) Transcript_451:58-666(-)
MGCTSFLVLGTVDLDNLEFSVVLLCEFIPGRGQSLAVSTPRGIKLNKRFAAGNNRGKGGISGNNNFITNGSSSFSSSGEVLISFNLGRTTNRRGIGLHKRGESGNGSLAFVVSGFTINKQFQSGVSSDSKFLADSLVLSTINFGDAESLSFISELIPGGGKTLAVSTPGGKELDHPNSRSNSAFEVVSCQVRDTGTGQTKGE